MLEHLFHSITQEPCAQQCLKNLAEFHLQQPSSLCYFYRELTGDESAPPTTEQADFNKRIKQMEDPNACELYNILQSSSFSKAVLFLYSDGGPDHRLTYVSVQISLVRLFLKLDLIFFVLGEQHLIIPGVIQLKESWQC